MKPIELGCIGGGMIVNDQLLPAFLQLRRNGVLSRIHCAAQGSASLRKLAEARWLKDHFPEFGDHPFRAWPDLATDESLRSADYYKQMLDVLPPGSIVYIAVPDSLHAKLIEECLERGFHVITVKSLCTNFADTCAIRDLADSKGLLVTVEFHKFCDTRVLEAVREWRSGKFGEARAIRATMIEDHGYLAGDSSFRHHFSPLTSDPCTYVGCHYVEQAFMLTGKRPIRVTVNGVQGRFGGTGEQCLSWAQAQMVLEGNTTMQLTNGLQFPAHHACRNHQGMEIFGSASDGWTGTYWLDIDNRRGMDRAFDVSQVPAGGRLTDAGSDYRAFVPRLDGQPGCNMEGYGFHAVRNLVEATLSVMEAGGVEQRQAKIKEIDSHGFIPTAANRAWLGLVYQAMRESVVNSGRPVDIDYQAGTTSFPW